MEYLSTVLLNLYIFLLTFSKGSGLPLVVAQPLTNTGINNRKILKDLIFTINNYISNLIGGNLNGLRVKW